MTAIRVIATERVVRVVARGAAGVAAVNVEAPLTSTGGVTPTLGISPATPSTPGSLSAEDKAKLDALADPNLSDAAPQALGNADAGTSTQAARGDHVHAHGAQGGGGLHSTATTTQAGFMPASAVNKLAGIQAGAQVNVPTNLGVGGTGDARTITSSTGSAAALPLATPSTAGLLSSFYATLLANFASNVRDQVLAMLAAGSNVTLTPAGVGASQTLTINATLSGGGSGTVTSVGLSLPGIFSVTGSPVTESGTISATLATQAPNRFWAGPSSGADAAPTFRAIAAADVPGLPASQIRGFLEGRLLGWGQFLASDGSAQQIELGTGFEFDAATLNLSANLQGWHAIEPSSKQDALTAGDRISIESGVISADAPPVSSVNSRTGAVTLADADVPADVLEWNTTSKTAALSDRGIYHYATATGDKTFEFTTTAGGAPGEYHIRNDAASGDVTLTATGVTLKAPKGGTLVLEPGDTVTVKRVASNVLHVFGSTKAA